MNVMVIGSSYNLPAGLTSYVLVWLVQASYSFFLLIKTNQTHQFPNFILSKNSACFGHFLCPSSGVFYYTFGAGIFHAGLLTASKQGQDGTRFHPDSAWKRSSKTCMKVTSAECTVENFW